jgi:U3 small nucleolar RNA-associated protein 14
MRELAFRADLKAKRVAKIKSKAYRRQKKKERERERRKLDGEAGDGEEREMVEEERMRMEVERARERATLKHKNTGKWARMMKAKGELDEDQRRDMNEMLERGEKLRRRIQGQASGSEDEDGGSDSGDDAFNELARIRAEGEADDEQPNLASKSVFNMKFMKDAEARKLREVIGTIDDFTREMGAMGADVDEDNEGEEGANGASVAVQRVGGRIVFNPVNAVRRLSAHIRTP